MRLEGKIMKLHQQAKLLRNVKYKRSQRNEKIQKKRQPLTSLTTELDERNHKNTDSKDRALSNANEIGPFKIIEKKKKILPISWWRLHKDKSATRWKKREQFWSKKWKRKKKQTLQKY